MRISFCHWVVLSMQQFHWSLILTNWDKSKPRGSMTFNGVIRSMSIHLKIILPLWMLMPNFSQGVYGYFLDKPILLHLLQSSTVYISKLVTIIKYEQYQNEWKHLYRNALAFKFYDDLCTQSWAIRWYYNSNFTLCNGFGH